MFHLLLAVIYLAFISLGLPDSLLGSAWPSMYPVFHVPVSYAGIISMIIAAGTVLSSLLSDRLTKKLGTGKITAISVATTAVALFGFSISHSFFALCLWAIPYGLGAGSVDAALNNYVALHYASRHMSWLHCMWGVGASVGPYIMGYALSNNQGWSMGYRYISFLQIALTAVLILSLPLWKQFQQKKSNKKSSSNSSDDLNNKEVKDGNQDNSTLSTNAPALTLRQIFQIPGAREILFAFFCYSAIEQTSSLWASSYLVLHLGYSSEKAAGFASLFFIGITVGRGISGFITFKLNDSQMIHLGEAIILVGILAMILPFGNTVALAGLILIGLGCAPIYPSIIHSTPAHFGADKSQAIIGVQMAFAYIGTCLMPPLFGIIARTVSVALFPFYLVLFLCLMFAMYEFVIKKTHPA